MKWLVIVLIFVIFLDVVYSHTCTYSDEYGRFTWLDCRSGYCCGPYNDKYCCTYVNVGGIVGGVIGFCVFVGIIATIVSCCFCACCPYYRGTRGTVITTTKTPITVTTVQDYQTTGGAGPYTAKPSTVYVAAPPPYS